MQANENRRESSVFALERGLLIMESFSRSEPELSLTEISEKAGLSLSTTSRLVATLEKSEFLIRNSKTLKYRLGSKLAHLGAVSVSAKGFREMAHPFLVSLRDHYNESVGLFILSKNQRVCIDSVESTQPLHRVIEIGTRTYLTNGASGKLLMAYSPETFMRNSLIEESRITLNELKKIREMGYVYSCDGYIRNLASVAVPIFDGDHLIKAALIISGPVSRMPTDNIPEIAKHMKDVAMEISVLLGY